MTPNEIYGLLIVGSFAAIVGLFFWKDILSFLRPDWFERYYIIDKRIIKTKLVWNKHKPTYEVKEGDRISTYNKGIYYFRDRVETYFWLKDHSESISLERLVDNRIDPELQDRKQKVRNADFWNTKGKELLKWLSIAAVIGIVILGVMEYNSMQKIDALQLTVTTLKEVLEYGSRIPVQ